MCAVPPILPLDPMPQWDDHLKARKIIAIAPSADVIHASFGSSISKLYSLRCAPSQPNRNHVDAIASFMQNESAVVAVGMLGMFLGFIGVVLLGAFSFASLIYRVPGGRLSFIGVVVILTMFSFVQLMTSSMELQYGPTGPVVEYSFYALGG